jgi:ethanolamine utilization cobalamin adenosyltransferase
MFIFLTNYIIWLKKTSFFKTKTNDLLVFWETPKKSYKHDHLLVIIAQE